ncbi:urease accessory protein UreE [Tychonema sp. LEGE 07199]|uniref:urease accessory protein UreE n=1 Tax=unclassified Tychonema TaxID=2642144 RepID=UPI00187DDF08|nr:MULTISPECIES: urease accessory protein UreE [unclassified Tychonema]MBE9119805.1 urease accessory protein UreE [Tychonema sp. LEGE 07199]MBE9132178.1 urease accessory protein UreE [Tychonema sp. LEGE 07196]
MLTFTKHLPANPDAAVSFTLAMTADDRTRSRHQFETEGGEKLHLSLPRGTVLRDRDLLLSEDGSSLVLVSAKPEPVITARASTNLLLLRAAYHLGNRHVALEVTENYLRLSPDSVLQGMLEKMGLEVIEEIVPFQPETGAYGHSH